MESTTKDNRMLTGMFEDRESTENAQQLACKRLY